MSTEPLPRGNLSGVELSSDGAQAQPAQMSQSTISFEKATVLNPERQSFIPIDDDPTQTKGLYTTLLAANQSLSFPHNVDDYYRITPDSRMRRIRGVIAELIVITATEPGKYETDEDNLKLTTIAEALSTHAMVTSAPFSLLDGAEFPFKLGLGCLTSLILISYHGLKIQKNA